MRISIAGTTCQLLKNLLSLHREGKSRLLWNTYNYELPVKFRTEAAVPLLNQLHGEPSSISIDGDQRDLLLKLLAWMSVSNYAFDERTICRALLKELQPQGCPIGAEVADFVVVKQSNMLVEIVCFGLADNENLVAITSTSFIVCDAYAIPGDPELQFIDCNLDDLMWPARLSAEEVIWGPYPHRLAA